MLKRAALIAALLASFAFLFGSLAIWLFVSTWVPTKGKARLIHELERHWPIDVSISAIRYTLFRGFVLEEVRVVEQLTGDVWLEAPTATVRVQWLSLLRGQVAFRSRARLDEPCETTAAFSGRYHLREKSLRLGLETTEIALTSLNPTLSRYKPAPLTEGVLRLNGELVQQPGEPAVLTGTVSAARLAWSAPGWRATGRLMLDGRAALPTRQGDPWKLDALVSLQDAELSGIPILQTVSKIEGTARLRPDRLDIEALTATVAGSTLDVSGAISPLARPSAELLLTSRVELSALAALLPLSVQAWRPAGISDLRAVCRGPLAPQPLLDCLARAELHRVTLEGPKLAAPVTDVTGILDYDHLAGRLSIQTLSARILQELVAVQGDVALNPVHLSLEIDGRLPLEVAAGWVQAAAPIADLEGLAELDLRLDGPPKALRARGHTSLHDVRARLTDLSKRVEGLTGRVSFTAEHIELSRLAFQLDGQPLILTAAIDLANPARVIATLEHPQGRVWASGRLTDQQILLDESEVRFEQSRLQLTGLISRQADRPSALSLSGTVELSQLSRLPFVPLPQLERWDLRGLMQVAAQLKGPVAQWRSATLSGRLRAERLSIRDVPVEQLTCDIEHGADGLDIRVPAALVAQGRLSGALAIEPDPQGSDGFLLEADLTGLQLASLTPAIPAWRFRSISGTASSHLSASGALADRSTWRGEGWLSASGEHLGDLPLLDKLFQQAIFGPLAEWLGLEPLRRAAITQASLHWRLAEEQMTTDDLRLAGLAGAAAIVIYAKGRLGLDQSIDFTVEPELSEQVILQSRAISGIAEVLKTAKLVDRVPKLFRYQLTGTLKDPKPRFRLTPQELLKEWLGSSTGGVLDGLLNQFLR